MVSNIELEYEQLEETNGWRDIFQVYRPLIEICDIKIAQRQQKRILCLFFKELRLNDESKPTTHAKHSLNLRYNRYKDILPCRHYSHFNSKLK